MPNALVFPGGGLEPQDMPQGVPQGVSQEITQSEEWRVWGFVSAQEALAERACALREAKEEAGEASVSTLTPQDLRCVGRWLTPKRLPKRFLTSFWCGVLEVPSPVRVDEAEVVEGAWWSPAEALERYEAGEIELAPPTIRLLHDLARLAQHPQLNTWWSPPPLERVEQLSRALSGEPQPTPICPNLIKDEEEGVLKLCLPGDEGYHEPERRYEPQPSRPHYLTRPLSEPTRPWRLVTRSLSAP